MPKNAYYYRKKGCKISEAPGGALNPRWPLAAGDSPPEHPRVVTPLTDIDLSMCVSIVNLSTLKNNTKETNSKC